MITKTIEGREFKLHEKVDITWGAQHRVERFIDSHVLAMMKGGKGEDKEEVFQTMLSNPDQFAEYLQLTENEEETNEIATLLLVTNLEYTELEELSIPTMNALKKEVTAIAGDAADFLNGLGISIRSRLMMSESENQKASVKE